MRPRLALIPIVLLLPLTACAGQTGGAPATAPPGETTVEATAEAPPVVVSKPATKPSKKHAPIRMSKKSVDLETFLGEVGRGTVIRFDVDANRIMELEHVYLP